MATTAKSADSFAFREVTVDAPSEAPIVTAMPNDTLAPFQTFRQYLGHPAPFEVATRAEPTERFVAIRQAALDERDDPVVVEPYYSEEPLRFYTLHGAPLAPTRLKGSPASPPRIPRQTNPPPRLEAHNRAEPGRTRGR